jgi:dUTP pyrophosphatase
MRETTVGVFKLKQEAITPTYGSEAAACFDMYSCLIENASVKFYDHNNNKRNKHVEDKSVILYSNERVLIPTGIIFDIPKGHSMRIHPRSGLSLKSGIVVANCEGVVDNDYVEQTYVMLHNISDKPFIVKHGDRIAQGELVVDSNVIFSDLKRKPLAKTDRNGGFGSTGV